MVCQYLEDQFELYILGAMSAEDARSVSDHVRGGCPLCQERLREAALTVYLLCQPAKPGRVAGKQKACLLRRAQKLKDHRAAQ
jgi:hypothetical protein